jgi:predicted RNase H-like HicB family nuclease
MRNEFTAVLEKDGEWLIAYCPEIPGANGQGKSEKECLQSLSEAIALILEDRRQDALRGVPPDAMLQEEPSNRKSEKLRNRYKELRNRGTEEPSNRKSDTKSC